MLTKMLSKCIFSMANVPFHRVIPGQGFTPRCRQTGLCAQQAQPMLEGEADTQLTTSPPLLILSCENPRNSPHSPASGQDHEDGHGITSNGQMGMASVGMACNTNPLFEVPVTPDPQEGPALGLSSPLAQVGLSCPQQGPAMQGAAWGRHPSNVSYALSSLCPRGQLSLQTGSSTLLARESVGENKGGRATGADAAAVPAQHRHSQGASRALGSPQHPHFFAGSF